MKNFRKMIAALAALCLLTAGLGSCGLPSNAPSPTSTPEPTPAPVPTPSPAPTPVVTIRGAFPGEEPAGFSDMLAAINAQLLKDTSTQLEIFWIPGDFGEGMAALPQSPDFFAADSSALPGYAENQTIRPLDDLMAQFGQDIYRNIDAQVIDSMKIGGKLMGVPGAGNTPIAGAELAFIYREDLRVKYGLPALSTLGDLENYLNAVKKNDPSLTPLSSADVALALMPALGPEVIIGGTEGSAAVSFGSGNAAACAAVQDAQSFKAAVAKARDWYMQGLLPKGIAAQSDPQGAVASGAAAATFGSALSLSAMQESLSQASPGASLACVPVTGGGTAYLEGDGGTALCISAGCENPGRVVQFWDWVYANQADYDLVSYGVQGKDYTLSGDRIAFSGGSAGSPLAPFFSNANYMRFAPGVPDAAVEQIRHWNSNAAPNPLLGFAFDGSGVQADLDKIKAVYATYGNLLFTGSTDETALLDEFGARLKAAGQDDVVTAAQEQVSAFLTK